MTELKLIDTDTPDMEEIKSAKTDLEKIMLLQKFGLMEPKLTEKERELCKTL